MNDEVKEILDYFQKDVDKYEESKKYLMEKYGYDEETIDNIHQHKRHINTKILLDYITNLQQENAGLKEIENKLNFIKNRKNQGASQENINKMAIEFVNSYLKEVSE